MPGPGRPSLAAIAACAAAALIAAGILVSAFRAKKAVPPTAAPAINNPCGPIPPCDPRLEMPCRAPAETMPCPL